MTACYEYYYLLHLQRYYSDAPIHPTQTAECFLNIGWANHHPRQGVFQQQFCFLAHYVRIRVV